MSKEHEPKGRPKFGIGQGTVACPAEFSLRLSRRNYGAIGKAELRKYRVFAF